MLQEGTVIAGAIFPVMCSLWRKERKMNRKHRFYISYYLRKRNFLDLLADIRVEDIGHLKTSAGYYQVLKF